MSNITPLGHLVQTRMDELGIDPATLGFRLGYSNPAKAAGRVLAFLDGNLVLSHKSRKAAARLPEALDLPFEAVEDAMRSTDALFAERACAVEQTRRLDAEREEAAWRAAFQPHAVLCTERTVPGSIPCFGFTGGAERWLILRLDPSRPPATFAGQVVTALPDRTGLGSDGLRYVTFFGRALGFYVNYTPDRCVRFDLAGDPVEVMLAAYQPGRGSYQLKGGPSRDSLWAKS